MAKTIFDTQFAKSSALDQQTKQVITYLVANSSTVLAPDIVMQLSQHTPAIRVPINQIFERLAYTGAIQPLFATIYPTGTSQINSIPDLLTMASVNVDLKYAPHAGVLSSIESLRDKIVINAGSLLKTRTDLRIPHISDITALHNLYVRGALCRSYAISDGWLTPSLCAFIVKSYSMALSTVLQANYSLTYPEQMLVAGIFSLYMCQMLSRHSDDKVMPPLFNMCTYVGNRQELMTLADRASELSKDGLTLQSTCQLVAKLGPDRMQKFNDNLFYRFCGNLGPDNIATMISFEYPPYWVHLLLQTLSGQKTSLAFKIKSILKEGANFARDLALSRQFIDNMLS